MNDTVTRLWELAVLARCNLFWKLEEPGKTTNNLSVFSIPLLRFLPGTTQIQGSIVTS